MRIIFCMPTAPYLFIVLFFLWSMPVFSQLNKKNIFVSSFSYPEISDKMIKILTNIKEIVFIVCYFAEEPPNSHLTETVTSVTNYFTFLTLPFHTVKLWNDRNAELILALLLLSCSCWWTLTCPTLQRSWNINWQNMIIPSLWLQRKIFILLAYDQS